MSCCFTLVIPSEELLHIERMLIRQWSKILLAFLQLAKFLRIYPLNS